MRQRLPSLNALRAFEAVARHLSLTEAANELHVTPAAISHHVKALEEDVGTTLLRRVKGEFVLTEAAQAALPPLRAGFDQIAESARRLRSDASNNILTISVGLTLASSFLVRRLGKFRETYPDIDVRLHTTDRVADFARDGVDVAIRFGRGIYPGMESFRLFEEEIFPVCSPALLEQGPPLEKPRDLEHFTLLHVEWTPHASELDDWGTWLQTAGADNVDATRGPRFSHSSIALQSAVEGQGVAFGSESLAGDEIRAGRLVRPFDLSLPMNYAYYLLYPEAMATVPKIANFRDWILAETDDMDRWYTGDLMAAPEPDAG